MLNLWIEIAQESVRRRNRFTVALPGGRSPVEFYSRLSALQEFDLWGRTHIFVGDEKFVPFDHESSNFGMIKTDLLDYISIPPANIHPIATGQKSVELAAEQFKGELMHFFEFKSANAPQFDLILLGAGTDGHTASLFPDDERINDTNRVVLPVSLPHLKEERITLTLPVINNACHVVFLHLGASKADIIKAIIDDKKDLPAAKVRPTHGRLLHLLDKEAARKLSIRETCPHEGRAVVYEA
ncbi:MAG: 6-phosphogluconolactonase [Omnitrophica WOR_2 bacterium RIFCSPHIGHO2_02_FULL_52_10]|nr:MAG: 6-phosphogluconolactonase [Omnitrophica WOR_2 bacterium RIFCSPHIGHO2_02_FULL_52_10]